MEIPVRMPQTRTDPSNWESTFGLFSFGQSTRVLPAQIESILFLDWSGDPASKRVKGDAVASAKTGSALGARQLETRRDGRFCTSFGAKKLARIYRYAQRSLCLILAHNSSVRMVQFGPEGP
jgi:hypothetical protein